MAPKRSPQSQRVSQTTPKSRSRLQPSAWAIKFKKDMADAWLASVDLDDHVALLQWAIFSDQTREAKRLIEFGVDVNARHEGDLGCTFLEHAAGKGNLEVVKLLIDFGADPNHVGKEGSALTCAAHRGHQAVYDFLKSRTNLQQQEIALRHWPYCRSTKAERDTVGRFVDAASRGQGKTVAAMLRSGIDVNSTGWAIGRTALHAACASGQSKVVDELLKAGADPNIRAFDGWAPLHSVAMAEDCEKLIKAGADPLALDDFNEGVIPCVAWSARRRHEWTPRRVKLNAAFDKNLASIFRQMLAVGADVNSRLSNGSTALFDVANMGLIESAKVLLEAGIERDAENKQGQTALEFATTQKMRNLLVKL